MEHTALDTRRLLHADSDSDGDGESLSSSSSSAAAVAGAPGNGVSPAPVTFSWRQFWAFTGPGWLMSMAYLDPGNLEADLQSGAYTKYELLYVVMLSTVAGGCYQILAARLGASTGRHLAQLCRSEYPRAVSRALWVMTELAIIGSDIQEVLGSAIALQILFQLPLWAGCLVTGLDTLTFLLLHRGGAKPHRDGAHVGNDALLDQPGNAERCLEMFFLMLIGTMCICFFVDFSVSQPDGLELLRGVLWPQLRKQNVMQAVAMVGAIIMPHNIFLHSALVQTRGIPCRDQDRVRQANYYFALEAAMALFVSFLVNAAVVGSFAASFYSASCAMLSDPSAEFPSLLVGTGIQTACIPVTTALSSGNAIYDAITGDVCQPDRNLSGMTCQPCYVVHASQTLYEFIGAAASLSSPTAGYCQEIGLAEAGDAVRDALGGYARVIWAIGLLASGQASTMTGTYAGQFVMEGLLQIRLPAWKRVALTRGVALIPAVLVAVASQHQQFRSDHFNEILNVLQSIQLPFALIPLLTFTSSRRLMGGAFANSYRVSMVLAILTTLLCGVNYTLVFSIVDETLPNEVSMVSGITLCLIVMGYVALLLFLVLEYSSSDPADASEKAEFASAGDGSDEDRDGGNHIGYYRRYGASSTHRPMDDEEEDTDGSRRALLGDEEEEEEEDVRV